MTASIDIGGTPSRLPPGWPPGVTTSAVPQEQTPWMRKTNGRRRLTLSSLRDGMPGLTPALGSSLAEAASVCLEEQGHGVVVTLTVEGRFEEVLALERSLVDEQMRSAHSHQERATENGAYGVALAAVCELTGLTVLQQASRWTGIDYWLGPKEGDIFRVSTRLEVSGIRKGSEHTIRARVRQKIEQAKRWKQFSTLALVAVVEFSRPVIRIMKL